MISELSDLKYKIKEEFYINQNIEKSLLLITKYYLNLIGNNSKQHECNPKLKCLLNCEEIGKIYIEIFFEIWKIKSNKSNKTYNKLLINLDLDLFNYTIDSKEYIRYHDYLLRFKSLILSKKMIDFYEFLNIFYVKPEFKLTIELNKCIISSFIKYNMLNEAKNHVLFIKKSFPFENNENFHKSNEFLLWLIEKIVRISIEKYYFHMEIAYKDEFILINNEQEGNINGLENYINEELKFFNLLIDRLELRQRLKKILNKYKEYINKDKNNDKKERINDKNKNDTRNNKDYPSISEIFQKFISKINKIFIISINKRSITKNNGIINLYNIILNEKFIKTLIIYKAFQVINLILKKNHIKITKIILFFLKYLYSIRIFHETVNLLIEYYKILVLN